MKDFVISTDTTSDLPESFIQKNDIDIHPLYYAFGDEIYGSNNGLPEKEFYARMRNGDLPTTMATNPEDSEKIFQKRIDEGLDILHIAFSSALSSSCNNSTLAANEIMEKTPGSKIIVIDSLSASMGEGLVVYRAIQLKNEGKSIDEVAQYINSHLQNFCHQFTVDDLNHLYRGGRVSKAAAVLGTLASIKPLLHVSAEGKLIPVGKVRGRKKSLIALVDRMEETIGSYRNETDVAFLSHGDCIEDAQFVADLVKERFNLDVWINPICPSIGSHAGPGTVALFHMGEHR